jgi:hypothetical protein
LSPSILRQRFSPDATILWIGGLVILMIAVPEARRVLGENPAFYTLLAGCASALPAEQFRLAPVAPPSIKCPGDPHYDGVLNSRTSEQGSCSHAAIARMLVAAWRCNTGSRHRQNGRRCWSGTGRPAGTRTPALRKSV